MMTSENGTNPAEFEENHSGDPGKDFAQAYQDLMRGEKTADTLETNLTNLERKLDDMLKSFENSEAAKKLDSNGASGQDKKDGSSGSK